MIKDIKKLIVKHNDTRDGILIRIELDQYVLKLVKLATILPYYSNSTLKGFIAYYANDPSKVDGYLTIILIDKDQRGQGIGKLLMEYSIIDLKNKGFKNYKLEVLKNNSRALNMYKNYGFKIQEDRGDLWLMNLKLVD
jgi:ribosomal protein S18 acetylase RimI-like enzyme